MKNKFLSVIVKLRSYVFGLCLLWGVLLGVQAQTISLQSDEGQALFAQATDKSAFWRIMRYHESQSQKSTCGVASGVAALNTLGVKGPAVAAIKGAKLFTQDNFFTPAAIEVRAKEVVYDHGYPLLDLAKTLQANGADVRAVPVTDKLSIDEVRADLRNSLSDSQAVVIALFLRSALGQANGGGHFSPLGAYDAKSDRFLVMDVTRFARPSIWVETEMLYRSMNTIDPDGKVPRGYLVVRKKSPDA